MLTLTNNKILVVDDEELIREVASMIIEEEGGAVLVAKNGREAVEIFKANQADINCVLMDFSMPEMNGYEAYLAMTQLEPQVKVVIVSGLKVVPEVEKLRREGKIAFLSKPFQPTELVAAIKSRIDKA